MKVKFNDTILTDDFLRVESRENATSFVYRQRAVNPDINNVLSLLKEVRKLCKEKGIKVKRAGYKKQLEGYKATGEYENIVNEYNDCWEQLKKGWSKLIEDGLYAPIQDNEDYLRLREVEFKMQKMHYRSSVLFQVNSIYKQLKEYKRKIESE